jgi:hypothetical protein
VYSYFGFANPAVDDISVVNEAVAETQGAFHRKEKLMHKN